MRTHSLHGNKQFISASVLNLTCRFCDSDFLENTFKNLGIDRIAMNSSNEYDLFIDRTIAFVHETSLLDENFDSQHELFCQQTYNEFINTLKARITVSQRLSSENNRSVELLDSLCQLLLSDSIYKSSIGPIFMNFLGAVAKFIPTRNLNSVFRLYIKTKELHTDSFLWKMKDIADDLPSKAIGLNKNQVLEVVASIKGVCSKCNTIHDSSHLTPLYFLAKDKPSKREILSVINTTLHEQFDRDLFYQASIYDIIEPSKSQWKQFVACSTPPREKIYPKWGTSRLFRDATDYRVDQMLNLHWKTGLPVSNTNQQKISVISPYYKWLINPDEFDYANFNPKWILHYNTKFFIDTFRGHNYLLASLATYLETHNDQQVRNVYQSLTI